MTHLQFAGVERCLFYPVLDSLIEIGEGLLPFCIFFLQGIYFSTVQAAITPLS